MSKTRIFLLAVAIPFAVATFPGCTIVRQALGKPAEATARDHRATGGQSTVTLQDGTKAAVKQSDNPQEPATIRYRVIRWQVIPPPATTQPPVVLEGQAPTSSVQLNALPFATIQPPSLFAWFGGKKEEKQEPPAPTPQPIPLPPGAVVLPDGSIAIPESVELETGVGSAQKQAELIGFLGLEQRGKDLATIAFLFGGAGILLFLRGWYIIGAVLVTGAFTTWQTNEATWAYLSAGVALLLFTVVKFMETKAALAVAKANPVVGLVASGVAEMAKPAPQPPED
jgi:hypothetical protein